MSASVFRIIVAAFLSNYSNVNKENAETQSLLFIISQKNDRNEFQFFSFALFAKLNDEWPSTEAVV